MEIVELGFEFWMGTHIKDDERGGGSQKIRSWNTWVKISGSTKID